MVTAMHRTTEGARVETQKFSTMIFLKIESPLLGSNWNEVRKQKIPAGVKVHV